MELKEKVAALGLKRAPHQLPQFMAKARVNYPRAFEPWTKEERALLTEAMCFTNEIEQLVALFGRSERSIINEGKRLIYASRKRQLVSLTMPLR